MKVGVVGLGGMGRSHARYIKGMDAVEEVIGCDLQEDLRQIAEKELGLRTVADLDSLLAENPDAVFVITQPTAHAMLIRPCLERGIPVFTEKPLSTDIAEGRELVALAEEKGVAFQVGFELRYCGMTRAMQAVMDEGLVGDPIRMSLIQNSGHHPKADRMTMERCGGIFYEKLCHQIDIYRMWLGEPERISAVRGPQVIQHYTIPDNVHAVLIFPEGRIGTIAFNTARAAHVGGTDDHEDRGHFYELALTCSNGSLTYEAWGETLEVVRFNHREDLKSELVESIDVRERYGEPAYDLENQNRDFLEHVIAGKPPRFPASDAQKSMEWVAKGEESLLKGGAWIS